MEVWAFEVLSFEIWVVVYLMNIDQKFLFVKIFNVAYVFGIDGKGFGFVLGWFGSHERQFDRKFEIMQNLRPMTIFTSNDHFRVQWSMSPPVTIFTSTNEFWVWRPILSPMTILSPIINLSLVTNFESNNQFWIKWPVLSPMTGFESDDQFWCGCDQCLFSLHKLIILKS